MDKKRKRKNTALPLLLAAFLLGGKLAEPIPVAIPGQEWQHLLLPIAKQTKTARQYPRKAGTPGKSPLGQTDKA